MAILSKEDQDRQLKKAGLSGDKLDVSLDEIDSFGNRESLMGIYKEVGGYNKMLKQRMTLINDSLTAAIPFTRNNLYLFCAYTGSGKSTVAANISYPLWQQKKKILVISNEESKEDILFRIGCLELGYSFNAWKKGTMSEDMIRQVCMLFPAIAEYVKICDVTWRDGLTTKVEGVKAALEAIKGKDFSCVLIDYYQLIKDSLYDSTRTRYDVLNDLRIWLGQYIKGCEVPVCLFVQLYSIGKRGGVKDIDARIKECSAIVEPATVIIEVVPNHAEKYSDFIIHKDRFGVAGYKIVCPFENGRFLKEMSEQELAIRTAEIKKKASTQEISKIMEDAAKKAIIAKSAGDMEMLNSADHQASKKL